MGESNTTYLRTFQRLALSVLVLLVLASMPKTVQAKPKVLDKIVIQNNPLAIQFHVNGKVPVKVIKIEKKELLVALKNVSLSKGFTVQGRQNPAIGNISVEALQGDVVAVVVKSLAPYGDVQSGFNKAGSQFLVSLGQGKKITPPAPKAAKPNPVESKPPAKVSPPEPPPAAPAIQPDKQPVREESKEVQEAGPETPPPSKPGALPVEKRAVKEATPPVYTPPQRKTSEFKGDISDLVPHIQKTACESKELANALELNQKQLYQEAFELLDQAVFLENFACLEQVYYLKAYAYYRSTSTQDYARLIKAERMFQDALVSFPNSTFLPFAYTAMGMIHTVLKNPSAAEGYFNIVTQGFPQYPGLPEVLYYLAGIYDAKGYTDKALGYYKEVFESPLENRYILDAGVGYGKALVKKNQYFEAMAVFNYVVKANAKKMYESPDLLLHMANANFELGLSKPARETSMRVLNLFPQIQDKDLILANVGDTYGMENNFQKAIQIYELVREKFPDSQGYVKASIGIARYLKTDQEKIDIYEMIKKKFPDDTYARIAMMRLAEIYQKNGEYDKCIKEIEDLLSTYPTGLRYEAVKLMQKAYEALFERQLKADEYTHVLNRYEQEHGKLDRMGSREIALSVGTAYLRANLYDEAFNHLMNAYKQYKRDTRSPELLFGLGLAMDESGRDEDALKLFAGFSQRFPKSKHRVDVLIRMGEIHLEKNRLKESAENFKQAYALSTNHLEKAKILILQSRISEKNKDLKTVSVLCEQAVKDVAAAPGKNYEALTETYKALGNAYFNLQSYVQAADAFAKALSFSQGDRVKANLGFMLGDAYQKGNILEKAKEAFEQVAGSEDSVWSRLARQRLNTLELAETMINS